MFTRFVAPLLLRAVYGNDSMKKTFLSLGLKEHERAVYGNDVRTFCENLKTKDLPNEKKWKMKKRPDMPESLMSWEITRRDDFLSKLTLEERRTLMSQPKLPNQMLRLLHQYTQMDVVDIDDWYEDFQRDCLYDCPDGKMKFDSRKFIAVYNLEFPNSHLKEGDFAEHLFNSFDCDQDGSLNFPEYFLGIWFTSKGTPREKLTWMFDLFQDVEKNRVKKKHIDFKALKSVVEATGKKDADTLAKSLFKTIQKKEDAPISKQEFVAGGEQDPQLIAYFDALRGPNFREIRESFDKEVKESNKIFLENKKKLTQEERGKKETEQLILSLHGILSKLSKKIKHHL